MTLKDPTWLVSHPVFLSLGDEAEAPSVLTSYVEGFAPVVNSVPAFLHLTLSRASGKADFLLREIWNDELGLNGTKSHPVLFDELHQSVRGRWGAQLRAQPFGVTAAVQMIQLCGSGSWPIGVAAMKAHESQFPIAYAAILPTLEKLLGPVSEFFRVHSQADIEHTEAGTKLLRWGISEGIISEVEVDNAFKHSTQILRELMDAIWHCTHLR